MFHELRQEHFAVESVAGFEARAQGTLRALRL